MAVSRVLIVDDNEMNRDMLLRRLQRQAYDVMAAEDGLQALEIVGQQAFDLILLDIMMPNISGYDVLAQLKQNPATQHIPVIMISAIDDIDSVVKCIEMGAEDYLFKPFNPTLLKARVSACLQRSRNHDNQYSAQMNILLHDATGGLGSLEAAGPLNGEQRDLLQRVQSNLSELGRIISQ